MNADTVEQAYRRYYPMILAKCTRMLGRQAQAEDAAQDAFMRLWAQRDGLRDERAVVSWVYRTATRVCLDVLRKSGRETGRATPPAGVTELTPERELAARQQLAQLIQGLDDTTMTIVTLTRVDRMTQAEVGELLDMSDRTVRRALAKADAQLATLRQEVHS